MNDPHACPKCGATLPPDAPEGLCPACLMSGGLPTDADAVTAPMGDSPRATASQPMAPRTPEDLAPLFPQLEILELLGRGGMGAVYKARQKNLNRFVALKILTIDPEAEGGFGERFQREAQALAKLNHPNIVGVFDFGVIDGLYYFLMEYVDGANLRSLIRGGELKPEAALALIPSFCDALQYAHDEGVVHRDIKPENVLVDKKGRVKIADFGLAKLLGQEHADHGLTLTGMALGTPRYMAPEQLDSPETVDHRADIYSLGVVFYEMLTGEIPMGRFALPSEKVQVDVRFDEIVLRTLERDVERRYQHASEVKTDVESVATLRSPQGGAKSVPPVPAATNTAAVDWQAHDERQLAWGVWAGLSALTYLGICLALQGTIMTLRSYFTQRSADDAAPFPWMQGLVFGAMLANAVIALVVLIKARNRSSDRFVRTGAINLVCAGALLTIACDSWFGVPSWLGSIYLGAAFIGWMVFRRPKIITAFKNLPAPSVAPPLGGASTSENPRLSRCALWGAIWAALGVLVVPFLLVSMTVPVRAGATGASGQALSPSINMILMGVLFVLFVIGGGALFGTTILGCIAVTQIKRSGGKLYGLPLAFADAVFFPMLLLHAAMAVLLGLVVVTILNASGVKAGLGASEMALLAILPLIADFFIVRALWRKTNPSLESKTPRRPVTGMNFFRQEAWWFSRSPWMRKIMGIVLGAVFVLALLGFFSFRMQATTTADHSGVVRTLYDYTVGLGDPWLYLFHRKIGTRGGMESGMNIAAGSTLFGFAALCAGIALIRLTRDQKRRASLADASTDMPQQRFFWNAVAGAVLFVVGIAGVIVHEVRNDNNGGLLADAVHEVHPDFTRPGITSLALKKAIADELQITPERLEKINAALNRAYLDFLKLENEHSEYRSENGHLVKIIKPFPDRSFDLAQRLATELRGIAGQTIIDEPERNAVWKLRLFRHAGEFTVRTELWEKDGTFHREEIWERDGKRVMGGKSGDTLDDMKLAFGHYVVDWEAQKDIVHEPRPDEATTSHTFGSDVLPVFIDRIRNGELARLLAVQDPDTVVKSGNPHAALVTQAGTSLGRACAEAELKRHGIVFTENPGPEELVRKLETLLGKE